MRKLAFFSILLSIIFTFNNGAMAGTCGLRHIDFDGTQDADDDEFIYQYFGVFVEARDNKACNDGCDLTKGKQWECDNQFCKANSLLFTDTSFYTWKGSQQSEKTLFRCSSSGPDQWIKMGTVPPCKDIPSGKELMTTVNGASGLFFIGTHQSIITSYCYATPEQMACLNDPYAEWKGGVCSCRTPENGHSYRWDSKQGECIEAGAPTTCPDKYKDAYVPCWQSQTNMGAKTCYRKCHNDKKGATTMIVECNPSYTPSNENTGWKTHDGRRLYSACVKSGGTTPNPPATSVSCRDGRTTLNGKACCDTGSMGTYDKASDTCTCKNDLEFVIENGTGYCRTKTGAQIFTCPAAQLTWVANLKISCGTNTEIQSKIEMLETYCKGTGVSETAFNTYISELMELSAKLCGVANDEKILCDKIPDAHMIGDTCTCDDKKKELNRTKQRCEESAAAIAEREQAASLERITSIKGKLDNLRSGLSKSVWKNKEGNFNTSRLVSDSVAGVVLGTAGGLITSNVIKKNQVKGGFEDINCTVRGQVVAGYGDEFQVGIQ